MPNYKKIREAAFKRMNAKDYDYGDNYLRDILLSHLGHNVEVAIYGDVDEPACVCLEDVDTYEVIIDAELYNWTPRSDSFGKNFAKYWAGDIWDALLEAYGHRVAIRGLGGCALLDLDTQKLVINTDVFTLAGRGEEE